MMTAEPIEHSTVASIRKILFSLALSIVLAFSACKQEDKPIPSSSQPVLVDAYVVKSTAKTTPVRAIGELKSEKEARLSFKTGGIIKQIHVKDGQQVAKGDILAILDLDEVQNHVSIAREAMKKAERDYNRAKKLYEDSVATLEQFQNAKTGLEVSRSNYKIANFNLEHSSIRAPSSGKVLKCLAETNEITAPGLPVFLFASTDKDWLVYATVTDKDIIALNHGDSANIRFDAYPDEEFKGKIISMDAFADPYTRTFKVEVELEEPPSRLVSGLIANVKLYPKNHQKLVKLPYRSLAGGEKKTSKVYKISGGKPVGITVKLVSLEDEYVLAGEQKQGISDGDTIIVRGLEDIIENRAIKINKIIGSTTNLMEFFKLATKKERCFQNNYLI